MAKFFLPIILIFCGSKLLAQDCDTYGMHIFNMLLNNDASLNDEFVGLIEYTAYIDRLEKLPEAQRENLKLGAIKSYDAVKKEYHKECKRILKIYKNTLAEKAEIAFDSCYFQQSKNFPDIGFMTCFYTVLLQGPEEELQLDAIRFECIKTQNGWRVLDGFFDGQNP